MWVDKDEIKFRHDHQHRRCRRSQCCITFFTCISKWTIYKSRHRLASLGAYLCVSKGILNWVKSMFSFVIFKSGSTNMCPEMVCAIFFFSYFVGLFIHFLLRLRCFFLAHKAATKANPKLSYAFLCVSTTLFVFLSSYWNTMYGNFIQIETMYYASVFAIRRTADCCTLYGNKTHSSVFIWSAVRWQQQQQQLGTHFLKW